MDIYEAIDKRRTVRGFKQGVTEETVRKLIIAGTKALSAGNRQPWEFIIIDDQDIIERIAKHKYQQNCTIAPAEGATQADVEAAALVQKKAYRNCSVVAVCYPSGLTLAVSAWACIQNMALAATAEGLGVLPSTFWGEHKEAVETLLGLPEGYKLATVLLIGVQDGNPPEKKMRPLFSWLHRNKFGIAP